MIACSGMHIILNHVHTYIHARLPKINKKIRNTLYAAYIYIKKICMYWP